MKTLIKKSLLVLMIAFITVFALGVGNKVKAADTKYSYTFTSKQYSANGTKTLSGVDWTLSGDGNYWGYDATKGHQFGSGNAPYKTMNLVSSEFSNVTAIKINTSGATSISATLSVYVGSSQFGQNVSLTKTATDYTFEGAATTGAIKLSYTQTSSKAIYIKSIEVTYSPVQSSNPSITVAGDNDCMVGNPFTLTPTLSNTTSNIVWSSTDDTVATVNNGVVTPLSMGTATITAALADDPSVLDTHEIKVFPNNEKELTIAEAIEVCEFTGNVETPYEYTARGTVSDEPSFNETYNSYTFTLTDSIDSIKVYGAKSTSGEAVEANYSVVVTGKLINYNSNTPEFNTNSTFERVIDESLDEFLTNLNSVQAHFSLAYKYKVSEQEVAATSEVTDTLNRDLTNVDGTTYASWSGKTSESSAVWAGQSAGGNDSIQLRSNNSNSGIVTTTSGGKVAKIIVTWHSNTTSGRSLDIYGKNTAYTNPTELYNSSDQGTKLGSIKYGTSTELEISGDYAYIGMRSNSGAMYLKEIQVVWIGEGSGTTTENVYTDDNFRIKCGVDNKLSDLEGLDDEYAYGIEVSTGSKTEYFVITDTTKNDGSISYFIIDLGKLMNNMDRMTVEFTVRAYVEYDGQKYYSESEKVHSVASAIKEYYEELGITNVEHLYNILVAEGKINK